MALMWPVLLMVQSAVACDVPVARYAKERWPADAYELTVFHRDPLLPSQQQVLTRIKEAAGKYQPTANVLTKTVDLRAAMTDDISALYKAIGSTPLPAAVLSYPPGGAPGRAVWIGPLSSGALDSLVHSPVRRCLAAQLVKGHDIVWVLVGSGDKARDDSAAEQLELRLKSSWTMGENGPSPVLRLSRDDVAETIFLAMLVNSEPDLDEYAGQPMAFPVFGRGRVLYSLVGRGIQDYNIDDAMSFLTGPCMCEIKAQNPGLDLLVPANWDDLAEPWDSTEETLPQLTGVLPVLDADGATTSTGLVSSVEPDQPVETEPAAAEPLPTDAETYRYLRMIVAAFMVITAIVFVWGAVILRKAAAHRR